MVRTQWVGNYPNQIAHYYGTEVEIMAMGGPDGAIGHPTDTGRMWEYERGSWILAGPLDRDPSTGHLMSSGPIVAPGMGRSAQPIRVGGIGDSIMLAQTQNGGFMQFIAAKSGGNAIIVLDGGVGGESLTQMDARFATTFGVADLDEIWIHGGTNSIDYSADKTALKSLIAKTFARGSRPVVFGIPPRGGSGATPQKSEYNSWAQNWCRSVGAEYVFIWDDVVDPATGGFAVSARIVGDTTDVHPNHACAIAGATRYASQRWPNIYGQMPTFSNVVGIPGNLAANALNLVDTNADGLADGWSVSSLGSGSAVNTMIQATTPDTGKWQTCAVTLTGTSDFYQLITPSVVVSGGKTYRVKFRLKTDGITAGNIRWQVISNAMQNSSVVNTIKWHASAQADLDGVIMFDHVVPVGAVVNQLKITLQANARLNSAATGTFSVVGYVVEDVSEGAL